MADGDRCIICGGANDSSVAWQTFCRNCAKETWGAAVVAKFIEMAVNCHDRLSAAEATIAELRERVAELEFEAGK